MATINWRVLGSSMSDTSLTPDVTIERGDGLTTPATGESIVIRSTFTQQITGFGGGIVFFIDANDLTGDTEDVTPMGAGTVYTQVVNLPQGSRGTFEYVIPANSVFTGSKFGPPETRILKVEYNTEVPDVTLSRPLQNTVRSLATLVTALWNHAVTGFGEGDITAQWTTTPEGLEGTIDSFAGSGNLYTFRVNFPANTRGTVILTVRERVATSVINSAKDGPPQPRSLTIPFDLTTGEAPDVPMPASLTISKPIATTYGLRRYTITFRWSRRVTNFDASDVDVEVISGSGIFTKGTLVEDADTPGVWRMQLTLTGAGRLKVSVDADSALAGTVQSPDADVSVEWDFDVVDPLVDVAGVTTLCDEFFTIDANPFLDSVLSSRSSDGHAGGAFFGVSDLIVHNNKVYGVVQIRKRREGRQNELSITDQAGAVLFMVDSTGCRILKAYPFVTRAARSLVVHDDAVHFFEGSHYQYYQQWIPRIIPGLKDNGYVYRIDKDSNVISEVGLNWRSVLPSTPEDRVEGLHGGTASPMLSTPDGLQIIAGWGDLDDVTEGIDPNTGRFPISADVRNWQWVEYNNYLDFRVSELQTNEKNAWDVFEDYARITNSVIGYERGQFIFRSRQPLKARLAGSLGSGDVVSFSFTSPTRDFPDSGLLWIGGELIRYTGITSSMFTGVTRGVEGTTASPQMEGADIYFVDALIEADAYAEPVNDMSLVIDTTRVYNHIEVLYGDTLRGARRKAVATSESSIRLHGKQLFEVSTDFNHHQVFWAEWLADQYLEHFSDRHLELRLELQSTFHISRLDTVLVSEPLRTGVRRLAQVYDVSQNYGNKTTQMELRTF